MLRLDCDLSQKCPYDRVASRHFKNPELLASLFFELFFMSNTETQSLKHRGETFCPVAALRRSYSALGQSEKILAIIKKSLQSPFSTSIM